MRIAIALSGGTDSLFALLKLRDAGHAVRGLHARLIPNADPDPVPRLTEICRKLGVELDVTDLTGPFEQLVIRPFADAYRRGATPNPCAHCNRDIKFGLIQQTAMNKGAEAMATGHYAALSEHPVYGPALRRGADKTKDQSYFLALTSMETLRRSLFPLGDETKASIRAWLAERGFEPPVPAESQDICFIPNNDYRNWLLDKATSLPGPGPVILLEDNAPERVIARHQGLWRYTEGQRKGLGIAWSSPLFVLGKDAARNALLVGPAARLNTRVCRASSLNFLVPRQNWPEQIWVQARFRQEPILAEVEMSDKNFNIRFQTPQAPPAPGQIAALYDADGFVLAGGIFI